MNAEKSLELFPGVQYAWSVSSFPAKVAPRVATLQRYLRVLCVEQGVTVQAIRDRNNQSALMKVRREFTRSATEQGFSLIEIGAALNCPHKAVPYLLDSGRKKSCWWSPDA